MEGGNQSINRAPSRTLEYMLCDSHHIEEGWLESAIQEDILPAAAPGRSLRLALPHGRRGSTRQGASDRGQRGRLTDTRKAGGDGRACGGRARRQDARRDRRVRPEMTRLPGRRLPQGAVAGDHKGRRVGSHRDRAGRPRRRCHKSASHDRDGVEGHPASAPVARSAEASVRLKERSGGGGVRALCEDSARPKRHRRGAVAESDGSARRPCCPARSAAPPVERSSSPKGVFVSVLGAACAP